MPDVYVDIFEFPDGTQVHFKDDRVDNLPKPMVYKGTLGTGGTITTLPVDGSATVGDTYKVITAGTYAGVDADIGDMFVCQTKTSSINTWDHIPSGDDQGGHEIAGDTGTTLPQEPVMQFVGTYSEDDNANNKTKVNVVRSMTKNQFDQLSEAEKKGFINITDLTSGSDDRFQPVIYSTDEREIGVWTDGKPLYEKTIYSATVTDATEVAHNIANIDKVAEVRCNILRYGTWNSGNFIFENSNHFSVVVSKTSYYCACAPATGVYNNLYLTIRYTKTTDTPGSGQWTPQGVPAHHYSTDEQIVGTWIDESTVYEKTINITTGFTENMTVAHSISNLGDIISYDGMVKLSSGFEPLVDYTLNLANYDIRVADFTSSDFIIHIGTARLSVIQAVYITIRYTKTS